MAQQPTGAPPAPAPQVAPAAGASPTAAAQPQKPAASSGPSILQGVRDVYNESGKEIGDLISQGRYGAAVGQTARAATAFIPAVADDVIGGAIRAVGPTVMDAGKQFLGINDARAQPSQPGAATQGQTSAANAPWDQSKLAGALGGLDKEMAAQSRVASVLDHSANGNVAGTGQHPMTNFDRTGMSNAQVAEANPAGRVTMTRQPNGTMSFSGGNVSGAVSYENSAGNPLVGGGLRGNGFSRVDSAPAGAGVAMDGAGNYAFSSNPIAAGAGGTAQGGAGPAAAGASSSASSVVNAALAAAAQRGDWDAVGAHYAGRGQNFGGQTAAQIQQAQAGPQGATIGGSTFGFDPQARNAQFDRDQLTRTIMDPNTKRSMRSALVSMDQTSSQNQNSAQRLASEERRSAANNDASMEQVAMRERGEDLRAANRNQLAAAELNQRYRDSDAQNQIRNLEAARAQRSAGILERYDAAKSEGERMALIRQHPDVFGQKTVQGKDRYITVGGGTSVVDGQTVKEPMSIFDTVTQQYVGGAGPSGGGASTAKQPEYTIGQVYVDQQSGAQRRWNGQGWDKV
ncbi:hypothetical protein LZ683_08915 [Comamonas testosteroni]|uniref:hypothetical protein n=1 Tax=Comamonas testosteroni TaxID=285 RepID=UPI0023AB5560|nr:hypothetical protein [Comamonas testosteroni]WEE79462.1 hypothetical protein LZ683_08915 [Comamonas testosteroni]